MRCLNRRTLLCCVTAILLLSTGAFAQTQYRAFWVDTFNSNLNTPDDVRTVIANARAANANAIFAQVRRRGDSWYLIGGEGLPDGVPIQPGFDPLQALIQEAHNYGIEMHAYVIVNAIYNKHPTVTGLPSNPNHVFNLHAWDPVTKAIRLRELADPDHSAGHSRQRHFDPLQRLPLQQRFLDRSGPSCGCRLHRQPVHRSGAQLRH